MKTLVLGGARSGKSRYAEQLAAQSDLAVVYIATATAQDAEMTQRITQHQQDRPDHWLTIEEPIRLAALLRKQSRPGRVLLVDCLTLWLTNLLCHADQDILERETQALLAALPDLTGQLILVSNEVGQGIMPLGELTRRYVDEAGRLHQRIAAQVERVTLMVAGLPLAVKGSEPIL